MCLPSFIKTRNTKDVISAGPKQDFLLHASNISTNTHPQRAPHQQLKCSKPQK